MQVYAQMQSKLLAPMWPRVDSHKSRSLAENDRGSPEPFDDDEDNNGFQLLNEVESGGTLSSLFTILRLFT